MKHTDTTKQKSDREIPRVLINTITKNTKNILINGIVTKITQTGGPTVFAVSDGTGTLSIKGFVGPGQRAFPHVEEGCYVSAAVEISLFKGELEGEIRQITLLDETAKASVIQSIEAFQLAQVHVKDVGFFVESPIFYKLKERFIQAAQQIKLAIVQERPIIVRHHNDCDGYSSGFALERAILPLIAKHHNCAKAPWEFYQRAPCQTPFYEIDDSIRDAANSLRNVAKFSNKMPLIIIADNGSCEADLMAIKQGKIHGIDFIVIDHHGFDTDCISAEVLTHINPFLVGESGSAVSAGILCVELARYINSEVTNISPIAAMSGFADRIDNANPELMNHYLAIAEKEGYTRQLLSDIGIVIDYVSSKVKFMEAREYIEVLFGQPRDKQRELVALMAPYIRELDRKGIAIGIANAVYETIDNVIIQFVDIEHTFPGFGFYPRPGRAVGLIHNHYEQNSAPAALITVGIMNTAMTIRATSSANFSVHDFKKYLKEMLPNSFAEGGGHKNAGSLTFVPFLKNDVVTLLKEFIAGR
ncbi:MAG: hypothetical protein JW795_24095 [Chitinivibrionales bacterium]|nr:hypothetical protein [Chitinivibrionales bacterium]